jgi:mitochondrial cardiolipin hydrolase
MEPNAMTLKELQSFLNCTIADRQLSGAEREAFTAWMDEHGPDSAQEFGVLRHTVFDVARNASASLDTAQILDWLEDTMKVVMPVKGQTPLPATSSAVFFSPGDACLQRIVHRFTHARQAADVCVFTITDDRITRAILDAHRRGLAIRIITDNDKAFDPGSDVQRLKEAGLALRVDETSFHMHHKFAIFDDTQLLNGSYNWTRSAADQNEENLVDSSEPQLIAAFRQEFERLWTELG